MALEPSHAAPAIVIEGHPNDALNGVYLASQDDPGHFVSEAVRPADCMHFARGSDETWRLQRIFDRSSATCWSFFPGSGFPSGSHTWQSWNDEASSWLPADAVVCTPLTRAEADDRLAAARARVRAEAFEQAQHTLFVAQHPVPLINGAYRQDTAVPEANGRPHWVHELGDYHLLFAVDGRWRFQSIFNAASTTSWSVFPKAGCAAVPVGARPWQWYCEASKTWLTASVDVDNKAPANPQPAALDCHALLAVHAVSPGSVYLARDPTGAFVTCSIVLLKICSPCSSSV